MTEPRRYDHAIYVDGEYCTNAMLTLKEAGELRGRGQDVRLAITGKTDPEHRFRGVRSVAQRDAYRRTVRGGRSY